MSVETALKSVLKRFSSQRRPLRRNASARSTESLESRALLTLIGTTATVSSTIQSTAGTNGMETDFGDPASATVVDNATDPEFATYVNRYDIDIDANTISMVFNPADDSTPDPSGVIEPGTFYRYYFEFDLSTNESIAAASASASATLVPNVSVNGNTVVVEIGPGMEIGDGFDALIDVDILRSGTVITGRKFHDANNDGVRTSNEAWLNGWTVEIRELNTNVIRTTQTREIDLNGNGQIDVETESGIYLFEDVAAGTFVVQETLFDGWTQSLPNNPNIVKAFDLDQNLEFATTGNDFLNWGGLNEKWFFGLSQQTGTAAPGPAWYYVTPDGSIYQWDGSPRTALSGTLLTTLDASYYDDPALIYDAPSPRQYIADVDVSVSTTFRGLDFGNYLAPPEFQVLLDQPTNAVTIDWNPAEGASYDIWISDIAAGRVFQIITDITKQPGGSPSDVPTIPFSTVLPDRSYRVWLRARSQDAVSGWTAAQRFELFRNPVNLVTSTRPTTVDATPIIEWRTLTGAVSYDLRVTDGESVTYLATNLAGTSHRLAQPLGFGIGYQVAVRANFPDGSRTDWDGGLPLRIDGRPTVSVSGKVVSWASVPAATEYEIWVNQFDDNGDLLRTRIVYASAITASSYNLPALQRGSYAAWVRAIRAENGVKYRSFWSERTDFQVTVAEQPSDEETQLLEIASVVTGLNIVQPTDQTKEDPWEPTAAITNSTPNDVVSATEAADPAPADDVAAVMAELASSDLLYDPQI